MNNETFDKVFNSIRDNGVLQAKPKNAMGGFWTSDVWKLENQTAMLTEEGAGKTLILHDFGVRISENYHGDLTFEVMGKDRFHDRELIQDILNLMIGRL